MLTYLLINHKKLSIPLFLLYCFCWCKVQQWYIWQWLRVASLGLLCITALCVCCFVFLTLITVKNSALLYIIRASQFALALLKMVWLAGVFPCRLAYNGCCWENFHNCTYTLMQVECIVPLVKICRLFQLCMQSPCLPNNLIEECVSWVQGVQELCAVGKFNTQEVPRSEDYIFLMLCT